MSDELMWSTAATAMWGFGPLLPPPYFLPILMPSPGLSKSKTQWPTILLAISLGCPDAPG